MAALGAERNWSSWAWLLTHVFTLSSPTPQPGFQVSVDLNVGQASAQCCHAVPQHFRIEGREALFSALAPAAWHRTQIERARIASPVQAIRAEDNGREGP